MKLIPKSKTEDIRDHKEYIKHKENKYLVNLIKKYKLIK